MTVNSFDRWPGGSYLYRWVGLLRVWRESSMLLQWAEPIGAALLCLVLGLAPFVSTTLIGVLLIACGGYWLLLTLSESERGGATSVHFLILLYWGMATVAMAFSPVKAEAFAGWVKLTLYLLWFALAARILRVPRWQNWTIATFLLVALIVSVYGIRQEIFGAEQLATWNDPNSELAGDTRAYSYLGNPNLLAGYLLGAVSLSLGAVLVWRGWMQKALAIAMVLANGACLYFTDSRGGWIGLLALLFAFFLLLRFWWHDRLPRFWQRWLLPLVLGTGAGLIAIAIISVEPLRLRVTSIFAGREDSSNNFRLNVWAAVLAMIRDRPLIGIGPGNDAFNQIYPLYQRPNYTALSAYSIYLEIAVESGLLGIASFFGVLASSLRVGWSRLEKLRAKRDRVGVWTLAALATMAGMLAHGLVDTVWYRPPIATLWWLMVAIVASNCAAVTPTDEKQV